MDKQKNKRKYLLFGSALIAISSSLYYLQTPSGKKVVEKVRTCKNKTVDGIKFVKDHRSEIYHNIKDISAELSTNIATIAEEVNKITDSALKVKENTENMWKKATQSIGDLKQLKEEINFPKNT